MKIKTIIVGPLRTNCYLLLSEGEIAVVDPGGEAEKIIEEIRKEEGRVKHIINTHSHPDHISANKELKKETGVEILEGLKEGDEIKIGDSVLRVLHTPGHTEDSVCLLGDSFIISGDVLFSGGYGRTDLPGGSEEKMEKSLQRLFKELPEETTIYPGHGEPFRKSGY